MENRTRRHFRHFAMAVMAVAIIAATTLTAVAQETEAITEGDLDAAYEEGYLDGYEAAIQQAYEAELRALYEQRMALEAASASQSEIDQVDAALVTSLMTVQQDQIAVYFDSMSDLQSQNAAYWAALEDAVYELADSIDDTEIVYTCAGVPAHWAPYAGYYANGAYVPPSSGSYVIPTAPTIINDIDIDEVVRNIHIEENSLTPEQLHVRAEQLRQTNQAGRFAGDEAAPGRRIGQEDVPPAIGGQPPALGTRGDLPQGLPANVGQGRLGQNQGLANQGPGRNSGIQAPGTGGPGGPNPQINNLPSPGTHRSGMTPPQRSGGGRSSGHSGGRRR